MCSVATPAKATEQALADKVVVNGPKTGFFRMFASQTRYIWPLGLMRATASCMHMFVYERTLSVTG